MPLWGYNVVKNMFRHGDPTEVSAHTTKFSGFMKVLYEKTAAEADRAGDLSAFKDWVFKQFGDLSDPKNALPLERFLDKLTPKEKKFWYIVQVEFLYDNFLLEKTGILKDENESLTTTRNQLIKTLNNLSDADMLDDEKLKKLEIELNGVKIGFLKSISDNVDQYMKGETSQPKKDALLKHLNLNAAAYNAADSAKKATMIFHFLACMTIVAVTVWYFFANYVGLAKGIYGLTGSLPSIKELTSVVFYLELPEKFLSNFFSSVLSLPGSLFKIEGASALPADVFWSLVSTMFHNRVFSAEEGFLSLYPGKGAWEAFIEAYKECTGVDVLGTCLGDAVKAYQPKNALAGP